MGDMLNTGPVGLATGSLQPSCSDGEMEKLTLASVMTLAEARRLYPSMSRATFYRRANKLVKRKASTGGTILTTVNEILRVYGSPDWMEK